MSGKEPSLLEPVTWAEEFFEYVSSEKAYSPKTLRNYHHAMEAFSATVAGRRWDQLDADPFRRYLYDLSVNRRLEPATVRLHFAALRSFFRFLVKRGRLTASPLGALKLPARKKHLPRFFTEKQIEAFLQTPLEMGKAAAGGRKKKRGRQMAAWQYFRDAAILEMLYSTGVRIQELISMDHADIDPASLSVRVVGKGSKERMVILGRPAWKAYEHYRAALPSAPVPAFVGPKDRRLTPRTVQQRFKVYLEAAGLDRHLTPHKLRHSFATHLLDHGADMRNVQELLGHANLSTTQIYAQLTTERMRKTYDEAHPAAK
jgi:integrase/recombinase XerC